MSWHGSVDRGVRLLKARCLLAFEGRPSSTAAFVIASTNKLLLRALCSFFSYSWQARRVQGADRCCVQVRLASWAQNRSSVQRAAVPAHLGERHLHGPGNAHARQEPRPRYTRRRRRVVNPFPSVYQPEIATETMVGSFGVSNHRTAFEYIA